ncbi:hypothetical protein PFISCL1PPCAC_17027, partial [Pristionchus fissidentatus]
TMRDLEHRNIVRYCTAWVEKPPPGWQMRSDARMLDRLPPNNRSIPIDHNYHCNLLYILMPVYSRSLEDWLSENPQQPRDTQIIKSLFKQMLEAVAYLHDKGHIHRDIKPSNILMDGDNGIRLCDFGTASQFETHEGQEISQTRTQKVGTPLYTSPEKDYWRYTSKVDVFALGLIYVEMNVRMTADVRSKAFDNYRRGIANDNIEIVNARTRELITGMTKVNSDERHSCRDILDSYFR